MIPFRLPRLGQIAFGVLLLFLILANTWSLVRAHRQAARAPTTPISHVVVIMMENHTFDNMFGTFPGANGITLTRAPNPLRSDYNHQGPAVLAAIDGGAMDEFPARSFVQYVRSDIPTYWDYATHFGLGDNFFTSAATNSDPNHVSLIAGQTGGIDETSDTNGCFSSANNIVYSRGLDSKQYWSYPCYNILSLPRLLDYVVFSDGNSSWADPFAPATYAGPNVGTAAHPATPVLSGTILSPDHDQDPDYPMPVEQ